MLGIAAFTQKEGKFFLTDDQQAKLKGYGFNDKFIQDLTTALNQPQADEKVGKDVALMGALLGEATSRIDSLTAKIESMKKEKETSAALIQQKERELAELQGKVKILSELPDVDPTKTGANAAAPSIDLNNMEQLGGLPGEMFALNRPYNRRAQAALLAVQGKTLAIENPSSIDYSTLREDLGAYYRQVWKEKIQSYLVELPTVRTIFPTESGHQDLDTLVNLFLGEFSQADNTIGSDFDKVVKGGYEFSHETLRMFDVMFVHKFKDLKQLEKLWIGSLNREGSKVIKWSFIEFILVETAKKLHNERELRTINGVRKNPKVNEPGLAMEAADGLYEFLRKKVDGHIDYTVDGGTTGKTVYQLKPFILPRITPGNIGEVFFQGTSMIPSEYRDSGRIRLYIPSYMLVWYHKYNEAKYGQNIDYQAGITYVKEYPSVKIVTIPNADGHCRIFWTFEGNVKTYEHIAGEMLDFQMEQQDWALKVWSNWKESTWAEAVGYKYTDDNKSQMDGSRQMIWLNDYDLSETTFIKGAANQNPSVALHTSVETVANSSLYTITDIADAKVGQRVTIKCGVDGEEGVEIKKEDKFSLISAAWNPKAGDTITLMKRSDGKFIELGRTTGASGAFQFEPDSTTPDVTGADTFVTGINTKETAITNLTNAQEGVIYTIHGSGSTNASTIANSGNFVLTDAMTLSDGKFIKLVKADGKFYEITRG